VPRFIYSVFAPGEAFRHLAKLSYQTIHKLGSSITTIKAPTPLTPFINKAVQFEGAFRWQAFTMMSVNSRYAVKPCAMEWN